MDISPISIGTPSCTGMVDKGADPAAAIFVDEWARAGPHRVAIFVATVGRVNNHRRPGDKSALGWCRGRRPWLGGGNFEPNCRDRRSPSTDC